MEIRRNEKGKQNEKKFLLPFLMEKQRKTTAGTEAKNVMAKTGKIE